VTRKRSPAGPSDAQDAAPGAPAPPAPPAGRLVIVATPIGNLGDLSPRAVRALAESSLILCEDTRVTRTLLAHAGIGTRLQSFTDHDDAAARARHVAAMAAGATIALVSDAGTPLLSDPGQALVADAIAAGVGVSIVPGPAASIAALAISGLPATPHLFLGFLPAKEGAARRVLEPVLAAEAAGLAATLVFYEAPHRLAGTLALLADLLGARPAAVVRELTKRFEEVRRGTLDGLAAHYAQHAARGEVTLVVGPAPAVAADAAAMPALLAEALARLDFRDAVAAVAGATGLPKREVYRAALAIRSADQALDDKPGQDGVEPEEA
jgi:16S rRNA (cytidine1402-2'-O)-methyltransferase